MSKRGLAGGLSAWGVSILMLLTSFGAQATLTAEQQASFNNRAFTGTFSETNTDMSPMSCGDPGTFGGSAQVALTNVQISGALVLTVVGVDSDGNAFAGSGPASIDPTGSGSFSPFNVFTPATSRITNIGGGFQVGSFTLNASGTNNVGCNVSVNYSGNDIVAGGNVVNPNTAPAILFAESGGHAGFSRQASVIISSHARSVLRGSTGGDGRFSFNPHENGFDASGSGLSAGGLFFGLPFGVWGNLTFSKSEDEFTSTAFKTRRVSALGGLDVLAAEGLVLGLALGYETSDTDTPESNSNSSADTEGFTIAPYMAYQITDIFSIDVSAGYTDLSTDQFRVAGTSIITSEAEGARWFVAGNANYGQSFGNWFVAGRLGWLVAQSDQDAFTESNGTTVSDFDFEVRQIRLGGEVSYAWGNWEPFVHGTFEHDYEQTAIQVVGAAAPESDHSGLVLGGGVRWYFGETMSASLVYSGVFGRDSFDQDSLNFLFRADF